MRRERYKTYFLITSTKRVSKHDVQVKILNFQIESHYEIKTELLNFLTFAFSTNVLRVN